MYKICEGKYIENVKDGIKERTFYSGETLPEDYIPPEDYISNGIIEKIGKNVKKQEKIKENKEKLNG